MKPTAIFKEMIADMRTQGQPIDYELAERNTRAAIREQSVEEEQASRLVDGFQPVCGIHLDIVLRPFFDAKREQNGEVTSLVGWQTTEDEYPYASLGTKCDHVCVYCDLKHVCMHCTPKPRSVEARIDPPCPLRIPGCRCSTGGGASIFEYYCNTGDPFMGAYVQGAEDEEFFQEEIGDEEDFEETGEEDVIEKETDYDGLLEDGASGGFLREVGGEKPLDDETGGEDFVESMAPPLFSPLSLWPLPLSATFWKGLVPGWEQDLPSPSQPQVDYNDNSDFLSEPSTIGTQSAVAAAQHAHGGRAESSMDVLQFPIAYKEYSPFVPTSQGLPNQVTRAASQNALDGEAPYSGKPVRTVLRPQTSHEQGPGHRSAAVVVDHSSQQLTTKKDSRGWEEEEKASVKALMVEVIAEGTHARTEERWKVISRRLSERYAIDRTWTAVKK